VSLVDYLVAGSVNMWAVSTAASLVVLTVESSGYDEAVDLVALLV
jgi:hypothetical protein